MLLNLISKSVMGMQARRLTKCDAKESARRAVPATPGSTIERCRSPEYAVAGSNPMLNVLDVAAT